MDRTTQTHLANLWAEDRETQGEAFQFILAATNEPVDWAYAVWNGLVARLRDADNHSRAISAQILCNLAKSDPEERILKDFEKLLSVTRDERFVTARHCLQALWKIGAAGVKQRRRLIKGLERRFAECPAEKNGTLIRSDIIQDLRQLYGATGDEKVKAKALALIETETDPKYRQKYARVWRAG
jgi:hypothetical protein